MRYILSQKGREILSGFARSKALLVFDYDGTLSPIVNDPQRAVMRRRTRALLAQLTRDYPCAMISGRAYSDLCSKVRGLGFRCLVGNHGSEWRPDPHPCGRVERRVRAWQSELEARLAGIPGIELENKGLSLTVHYRLAPRSGARVVREARKLPDARIIGGKRVVNLVPRNASDKGRAMLKLLETLGCDRAIYIGDDVTDEDVFRLRDPRVLCVRVGTRGKTAAPYYVRTQSEVDRFLLELRQAHAGRSRTQRRPLRKPGN